MANLHVFAILNQTAADSGIPPTSHAFRDLVLIPDSRNTNRVIGETLHGHPINLERPAGRGSRAVFQGFGSSPGERVRPRRAAVDPGSWCRFLVKVVVSHTGSSKPGEPVQKIIVELFHQLAFRADAVEHLEQPPGAATWSSKALSNCSGGIEGRPALE
jgi:hypothetical protein